MLHEIIENTKKQVARNKELFPIKLLESSIYFNSKCVSFSHYITKKDKSGIIAEFKRKSPSKGVINRYADVMQTTIGYMQAGASALSVLTENNYFMGKNEDLIIARNANYCPILRKDFIVDEYQVVETKSIGADAMLLIAACLEKKQLQKLYQLARFLGMEVLFEIHSIEELEKLPGDDLIIGVNNRNLKTMEVNIQASIDVAKEFSSKFILVSESGLKTVDEIKILKSLGYSGFLIGENFMKTPDPAYALKQFVNDLKKKKYAN